MRKILAHSELIVASMLALAHICLYLIDVTFNSDRNGWAGIFVFLVDLPISIPLAKLSNVHGLVVLLIGGTVWWFGLGILISLLSRRLYRFAIRLGKDQPEA